MPTYLDTPVPAPTGQPKPATPRPSDAEIARAMNRAAVFARDLAAKEPDPYTREYLSRKVSEFQAYANALRQPPVVRASVEVTDEMVERAARRMVMEYEVKAWGNLSMDDHEHYRRLASAALTAALTGEGR